MKLSSDYTFHPKLIRSKRKTISIIVRNDASVEVRAPLKMKQSEIDAFVLSKHKWIDKSTAKIRELNTKHQLAPGSVIPLLGLERTIIYADVKEPVIADDKILIPLGKDIKSGLLSLLKRAAQGYIPNRTAEISKTMNIQYSSILINSASTHWGSCVADRIHFSCLTMLADKETIDYVIIHELSHILHHNHSPLFWEEVEKYCPDFSIHRQKLKAFSYIAQGLK